MFIRGYSFCFNNLSRICIPSPSFYSLRLLFPASIKPHINSNLLIKSSTQLQFSLLNLLKGNSLYSVDS